MLSPIRLNPLITADLQAEGRPAHTNAVARCCGRKQKTRSAPTRSLVPESGAENDNVLARPVAAGVGAAPGARVHRVVIVVGAMPRIIEQMLAHFVTWCPGDAEDRSRMAFVSDPICGPRERVRNWSTDWPSIPLSSAVSIWQHRISLTPVENVMQEAVVVSLLTAQHFYTRARRGASGFALCQWLWTI